MVVRGKSTIFRVTGILIGENTVRALKSEIQYLEGDQEVLSILEAALAEANGCPPFTQQKEHRLVDAIVRGAIQLQLSPEERRTLQIGIEIVPSCYSDCKCCALLRFFHQGKHSLLKDDSSAALPEFLLKNGKLREELQVLFGDIVLNVDQHFYGFTQLYATVGDISAE
jgi:hypothetical protein